MGTNLDCVSVRALLDVNREKIDLIGNSAIGDFKGQWHPVIKAMAEWFNALPLSLALYEEPGGAFRSCVEAAYFVGRQAKAAIFTGELMSQDRRLMEPQYHYAAFLAAMVSWIDMPNRFYSIGVDGVVYNPSTDGGLSTFVGKCSSFDLAKKDEVLLESRQRTIFLASSVLKNYIGNLVPNIQDELFSAINPGQGNQGNETVLQRVVRKGLAQAEELERRVKKLEVVPQPRETASANMMRGSADAVLDSMSPHAMSDEKNSPKQKDVDSSRSKVDENIDGTVEGGNRKPKTIESDGKMVGTEVKGDAISKNHNGVEQLSIPGVPNKYAELFRALAEDIRSDKKPKDKTEWRSSGLYIPKTYFNGYGQNVAVLVKELQAMKIVLGTFEKQVLIEPVTGDLLCPRNAK